MQNKPKFKIGDTIFFTSRDRDIITIGKDVIRVIESYIDGERMGFLYHGELGTDEQEAFSESEIKKKFSNFTNI